MFRTNSSYLFNDNASKFLNPKNTEHSPTLQEQAVTGGRREKPQVHRRQKMQGIPAPKTLPT
jgi:hypothetical protein